MRSTPPSSRRTTSRSSPRSIPPCSSRRSPSSTTPAKCFCTSRTSSASTSAAAIASPNILTELGRLRELAFRAVKEGSGKPLDLESYDSYYDHLFIWDREKLRIVGAYRLGGTDRILPEHGRSGLYTSSLFRIKRGLLDQIDPAIELGRSFVRLEEQKSFAPLMLLWRGISLYVCRYPRYRYLFGPVSISAAYSSMSKRLLMRFLEIHSSLPQLGKLIKPRNPPRMRGHRSVDPAQFSMVVRDLKEVNELISELEADGKSMPVLVRQYLKLGGQLLGFNIDPEFGDVLDGLMLFDVPAMDRASSTATWARKSAPSTSPATAWRAERGRPAASLDTSRFAALSGGVGGGVERGGVGGWVV